MDVNKKAEVVGGKMEASTHTKRVKVGKPKGGSNAGVIIAVIVILITGLGIGAAVFVIVMFCFLFEIFTHNVNVDIKSKYMYKNILMSKFSNKTKIFKFRCI